MTFDWVCGLEQDVVFGINGQMEKRPSFLDIARILDLEGIGGCGKDTQERKIEKYLRGLGIEFLMTREHTRDTPPGALIERIIHKKEPQIDSLALQLMYVSDRRNHYVRKIKPSLDVGMTVVANRYYPSTVAYSPPEWRQTMLDLNQTVVARPDLVIIIDTDPEVAARRVETRGDGDIFDKVESLKRCREGYEWYAANSGDPVVWVDGNGTIEQVFELIKEEIQIRR